MLLTDRLTANRNRKSSNLNRRWTSTSQRNPQWNRS